MSLYRQNLENLKALGVIQDQFNLPNLYPESMPITLQIRLYSLSKKAPIKGCRYCLLPYQFSFDSALHFS